MAGLALSGLSERGALITGIVAVSAAAVLSVGMIVGVVLYKHGVAEADVLDKVTERRGQIRALTPIEMFVPPKPVLETQADGTERRVVRNSAGELLAILTLKPGQTDDLGRPNIEDNNQNDDTVDDVEDEPIEEEPSLPIDQEPMQPTGPVSAPLTDEPLTPEVIAFSERVFALHNKLKLPADCEIFRQAAQFPHHRSYLHKHAFAHMIKNREHILAVCDAMQAAHFDPAAVVAPGAGKTELSKEASIGVMECRKLNTVEPANINKFMETHELSADAPIGVVGDTLGNVADAAGHMIDAVKRKEDDKPEPQSGEGADSGEWDD